MTLLQVRMEFREPDQSTTGLINAAGADVEWDAAWASVQT